VPCEHKNMFPIIILHWLLFVFVIIVQVRRVGPLRGSGSLSPRPPPPPHADPRPQHPVPTRPPPGTLRPPTTHPPPTPPPRPTPTDPPSDPFPTPPPRPCCDPDSRGIGWVGWGRGRGLETVGAEGRRGREGDVSRQVASSRIFESLFLTISNHL